MGSEKGCFVVVGIHFTVMDCLENISQVVLFSFKSIVLGFFFLVLFYLAISNMLLLMWSWTSVKLMWEDLQKEQSNELPVDT